MQFTPDELSILRQAAEIILRSQTAPAQPELATGLFTVTHAWINQFKTPAGAWKAKQLRAIGVPWPPRAGWPERVEGTQITQVNRRLFESFACEELPSHGFGPSDTTRPAIPKPNCDCDVPPWEDCIHTKAT